MRTLAQARKMEINRIDTVMNDPNRCRKMVTRPCASYSAVLFLLTGWLALVTPLRADNPPTFVFQIDSSAVPGGFQPLCIALDASNNLYVIDALNSRVIKFTSGAHI